MNAEERVLKSVQDAQRVLGEYIVPGDRDPEMTINRLLTVLDDEVGEGGLGTGPEVQANED